MLKDTGILLVDDDAKVRKMLSRYLVSEGFRVVEAEDGAAMRAAFAEATFDLVLLDLVLPGEDGLSLMREIRRDSEIPVIMITGKGELIDRVAGLETGADDYIAKPFHLREVLARVRSVLRRSAAATGAATAEKAAGDGTLEAEPGAGPAERFGFDGWQIDLASRVLLQPDGAPVELTTAEFNLLSTFVKAPNRPLSRDHLMDSLKGQDWTPFDRSIDTQVGRLRKKIESDPRHPALIKTVRGIGYVFAPRVQAL